ncbi:MAG: NusG domain II-containing protein [Syntrophales bacterium]|jgi:hypothetical protein|nr:NusG domain II-containing protein [Syntrophales bacterium]
MITRRDFFRMTGLAAAALGAGYTTGKWTAPAAGDHFSISGFLPADRETVADLATIFSRRAGVAGQPVVLAASPWKESILAGSRAAVADERSGKRFEGPVVFRMTSLPQGVPADILVADSRTGVYRPDSDFTVAMAEFRSRLQGKTATHFFSAEGRVRGPISIFAGTERFVVMESEKGIFDRIPLTASSHTIAVEGAHGKTGITIADGRVSVHSASCRNQLCRHLGPISREGQLIACAPNRVLIRIEAA